MYKLQFPNRFRWGSATAALQIEGATDADGRGTSVWEEFCQQHPERIYQGATPEVACDHYHRYQEDVGWMKKLHHNGYRFSIGWPRVLPQGKGAVNAKGLDFYDKLVDELLSAGVEPNITLYHWDLPLPLAREGGWENPKTVDAFVQFAEACFQRLGDRVELWASINEPAWTILNGYLTGLHPPCKSNRKAALLAAHHLLAAHAAVSKVRPCGIALNFSPVYPASGSKADVAAAQRADLILNDWFLHPVVKGCYPPELVDLYQSLGLMPESPHAIDSAPPSFLGLNYYYPHHARAGAESDQFHINNSGNPDEACKFSLKGCFDLVKNPNGRYTDWAWEIHPETLTKLLLKVSAASPNTPLYVTENGIGLPDQLVNGRVNDSARIDFVREHLVAIHKAIEAGADVRGYYMWSLLDNFSWINGYKKRYGFLYVDRETQQRTPKNGALWFAEVAKSGALPIEED